MKLNPLSTELGLPLENVTSSASFDRGTSLMSDE